MKTLTIPSKSNQILNLIFFVFLIISLRLWQLCIFQHEEKIKEVLKPQQKVFVQNANRGGIYDRFGMPLAINKIQYRAGVFYSPIRQIPSISYKKNIKGKKIKTYPRRDYIEKLSKELSAILHIDSERVEDLIHSKASIRFDTPFILKEGISEEEYYQLKMLEGNWPGVYAGIESTRHYPQGKVAGHIIGYMGAINKEEYEGILEEKATLEKFLGQWQMGYFPHLPNGMESVGQVRNRLKELKERSYSIYDLVGKTGVEAKFDESLKGYLGRSFFYSDAKGQFLKPLSLAQKSLSGKKLTLTISAELQKHAEELLIENERIRRSLYINPTTGALTYQKEPWIKGGAIVVMDPKNGEVLALASCPRFDPGDFILCNDEKKQGQSRKNVPKWLEGESFIADVWNGRVHLTKEIFDPRTQKVVEDEFPLSWDFFLNLILPVDCPIREAFKKIKDVYSAIELQEAFEKMLEISNNPKPFNLLKVLYKGSNHVPYPEGKIPSRIVQLIEKNLEENKEEYAFHKKCLDHYLSKLDSNYDKLLLIDLCRLSVNAQLVSVEMQNDLRDFSLSEHREMEVAYFGLNIALKKMTQDLFRIHHFKKWREKHQKSFLKEKRKLELSNKIYPKPYIDYLDKEEINQFNDFWNANQKLIMKAFLTGKLDLNVESSLLPYLNHFILWAKEVQNGAHKSIDWFDNYQKIRSLFDRWDIDKVLNYFSILRSFSDLNRPLYGKYIKVNQKKPIEQDLAKSFYPKHGFGYSRSYAFSQATPQGSLFKLVTAYESLVQRYKDNPALDGHQLNPLTFIDDLHASPEGNKKWNVGYSTSGASISQHYKGGRLPRTHRRGIGKIDLMDALAVSSNSYFGILATDVIQNPEDLNNAARLFSFGAKTGIDIPGEISGALPKDLSHNQTGLYSYSIGQHTLVVTPLQTALFLSSLANGGVVYKPKIIHTTKGLDLKGLNLFDLNKNEYDFKETLSCIGVDYPLFTCKERGENAQEQKYDEEIKRIIEIPKPVEHYLLKSMKEIVHSKRGSANPNKVRNYSMTHPNYIAYQELKNQIIGKTSSAEIREIVDLDLKRGINTYKHVWFGGVVYKEDIQNDKFNDPELVVIVYLRYGDFGREAAPLAASIAKKWREIKKNHSNENML